MAGITQVIRVSNRCDGDDEYDNDKNSNAYRRRIPGEQWRFEAIMFIPPNKNGENGENDEAVETRLPRIETLSEKQIVNLTQNHSLVSAIENSKSVKDALAAVRRQFPEFNRSVRWAQKLYASYKRYGVTALFDGRLKNQNQSGVLNSEVQQIVLEWWYGRPAAGPKEIWRQVVIECKKKTLPEPAYKTVQNFLKNQTEANKLVRAGKIKTWDKQGKPVVRFNLTHYSNQRWHIDHTRLDIWIRLWVIDRGVGCSFARHRGVRTFVKMPGRLDDSHLTTKSDFTEGKH